jgi:transcriptional regulator with XRE-family HTH domain
MCKSFNRSKPRGMDVGTKIRKLRELKNLTQEHLVDQIGVSQAYYNRIENGQANINFDRLRQIAGVLEIDPLALLAFDEVQYFNQVSHSQIGSGQYIHQAYSEEERKLYREQISRLEGEVAFLRGLLERAGQAGSA